MAGNLAVTWIHGAANCAASTDPPLQVHPFNADTFILRQSKCVTFEAPFLYLLVGSSRALLVDTGTAASPARCPIRATVDGIVGGRPLVVVHSHSHGDHVAGDPQFVGRPNTRIVPVGLDAVKSFFRLPSWPNGTGTIDLGGRIVDVIPAPGHEASHVALYDRRERILLAGDTVYPGLLVINQFAAYRRTIARLKAFSDANPVALVLGAHVEMTSTPRRWFGLGATHQPNEHPLQLAASHLAEIDTAIRAMGSAPRVDRRAEFILFPAGSPMPPP
jgi:glyoxylase-like metal-dependent hydrolase (beta-lactamase superfamily II)